MTLPTPKGSYIFTFIKTLRTITQFSYNISCSPQMKVLVYLGGDLDSISCVSSTPEVGAYRSSKCII